MTTLQIINLAIMLAFFLCYSYQFFYIPVAWFKKDAPHREPSPHRIAVLIAARNEQSVIGNLIDSVKAQDYPTELVDVFVVADNCTDLTGSVAGAHGANVYFRNDQTQVGKGYALQYLLHCIEEDFAPYDGYLVLDADNVLSPNYITEINKTFSDGYQIVTAAPRTTATTGSAPVTLSGSCGRAVTSTARGAVWAAPAPSAAQVSCSPAGFWKSAAAGTSSC